MDTPAHRPSCKTMTQYFFHLHQCDKVYRDDVGADVADLAAACARATAAARGLMAAEIVDGKLCLGCRIEIADEAGRVVAIVPFKDAVDVVTL